MFSTRKIKIDKDLYHRLSAAAEQAGYSSTDEFIRHVLERELSGTPELSDQEQAERQLRGLGYLEILAATAEISRSASSETCQLMNLINGFLTSATAWILTPWSRWPLMTLLVVSAATGVLMSVMFRYTSNQRALGNVADRIKGHLLAIKLFKDDLGGMFRSLGQIFRYVLARLWYSVFPMLIMIVPLLFLLCQLALWYEYRPLSLDESAVVQLQLKPDAWPSYQRAELESSDFTVETDPLRDEAQHSIFWRIKPKVATASELRWPMGPQSVAKQVVASTDTDALRLVSKRRAGRKWWDRILYPGEPAFGAMSPVQSIDIHYPRRETRVLGINSPWWLTFFVVSIVFALLMQPIVKVRF